MDSINHPCSAPKQSKLSKTFNRVIHLKSATKSLSNNGFCLQTPQEHKQKRTQNANSRKDESNSKNRAAMEAFAAKLFATISTLKAAYAELQIAQCPYNNERVQKADLAVVQELKMLSELKQRFLKKQIGSSPPHVTLLLAEIEEQQSLMKMYEITMKKMQREIDSKDDHIANLQEKYSEASAKNRALEKRLNSSGQFSVFNGVKFSDSELNPSSFNWVLNYAIRSVKSFVKVMIQEMEKSNWELNSAAKSIVHDDVIFLRKNHTCFAFESFVSKEMFEGFDFQHFSDQSVSEQPRSVFVDRFKKLKSNDPVIFLKRNPSSGFDKFVRRKYLRVVHPKMETSFSGNLSQRKMINAGEVPETAFFAAFAEMAKRVWLLHCLAFSSDREVGIFQVGRNCRFSEVYMESVAENGGEDGGDGGLRVAFTVVPGFRIGKTVIQSQVYLYPARSPAKS